MKNKTFFRNLLSLKKLINKFLKFYIFFRIWGSQIRSRKEGFVMVQDNQAGEKN